MRIREWNVDEAPPIDLLLLADPSQKLVDKYLNKGFCCVADSNGEIIGVYILLPISTSTVELVNIAVSENEQGRGIGKQLLKDAIHQSKSKGYNTIEVGTGNSSIEQLAFYQKCGFRIIGVESDYFTRHYEDKIIENGIWCRDRILLSYDINKR